MNDWRERVIAAPLFRAVTGTYAAKERRVKRSTAIGSLAALAALTASHRSIANAAPDKIRVLRASVESAMGPEYALERGLFDKYNLDVTIEISASGSASTAAVLGGAAEIATSNTLGLVVAHAKSIPVTLFAPGAAYMPGPPTVGVMVAKNSPYHVAADLQGKTVGVEGLHDLGTLAIMAWMQKSGVDPKTVGFVEMPTAAQAAAVVRGTLDAAEIFTPFYEQSLDTCRSLTMPYSAIADRFLINGWFAQNDWLTANRDVAARFTGAVIEAQMWATRERDKSGKMLAAFSKIDPAIIARMARATYASNLDATLVQPVVDVAAQFGLIQGAFPASQILAS
jgi:NitT/TauT family transport system substrate-binding protein